MIRQFTSTCYIVDNSRFLFIPHPKHEKWLPPGGHLEDNETPAEAAKREVREETGLEIAFCMQENLWVDYPNAKSIERPYCCLLESLPERKGESAHEHIDFIFIARPTGGVLSEGRWFTVEEIDALARNAQIFPDTWDVIQKLAMHEKVF